MSGTKIGGKKAAKTNKKKFGKGFYATIGAKGGAASSNGGFYNDSTKASTAGKAGGRKSKRGHKFIKEENGLMYHRNNVTGEIVTKEIKS